MLGPYFQGLSSWAFARAVNVAGQVIHGAHYGHGSHVHIMHVLNGQAGGAGNRDQVRRYLRIAGEAESETESG